MVQRYEQLPPVARFHPIGSRPQPIYTHPMQARHPQWSRKFKTKLRAKYRITNLGTARQFLGIQITTGSADSLSHTICLGQQDFITSILKRFNMHNAHGAAMPMDVHVKLDLAKDRGERKVDPLKYQTIVGSLMYIALATRPDISHAVSALSRFTAHHCLHFSKSNTNTTGYTDSDWANDSADRKSQGRVFILKNGAISWQSQKQDLVAASTTEAEYIACSEASERS